VTPENPEQASADQEKIILFLAPYAGASEAIFYKWRSLLPPWIIPEPLLLPGRGKRFSSALCLTWEELVAILSEDIKPRLGNRFAFFGHSMGALIALELAHAVRAQYGKKPVWLGVSACIAPSRRVWDDKWLKTRDKEIWEKLKSYGTTPDAVLKNPELSALIFPIIRADFHLCGVYKRNDRAKLDMPIAVYGGTTDDVSEPRSNLADWSAETSGPCQLEMIEGGHFFLNERPEWIVPSVVHALSNIYER